ncbi:MAG: hypothetical protein ABFC98_06030 [Candidatus Cloacimonas sp.]
MAGSLVTHQGDTPYMFTEGGPDYKRLYRSKRDLALTLEVSLIPGYGVVPQGAALGKIVAGDRAGYWVPYSPNPNESAGDPVSWDGARAYLLEDSGTAQTVYVSLDDSYKFKVGDVIAVNSDGGTPYQLTITVIDRTTYRNKAAITYTGTVSASHTSANNAHIAIDTENANTYSYCKGILEFAVDTGVGVNAKGGLGVRIVTNAILIEGLCENVDDAAVTDLSAVEDGQYLILK